MSLKIFLTALSVMATVTLQGKININTNGQLPGVGSVAPDFKAVRADLSEVSLSEFKGKRVVISVFSVQRRKEWSASSCSIGMIGVERLSIGRASS